MYIREAQYAGDIAVFSDSDCDFFIGEIKLESVNRFKCFGSMLSKGSNLKEELTAQIQSTSCAYEYERPSLH